VRVLVFVCARARGLACAYVYVSCCEASALGGLALGRGSSGDGVRVINGGLVLGR
jgi:hypothetical protein